VGTTDGEQPTVNLLWAGGWDSTYRLLELVVVQRRSVQPHYIIDTNRRSTIMELTTMQHIRTALVERIHPEILKIAPTQIVSIHDLLPNPMIAEKFKRLKQRAYLGDQYEWLACYADQFSIAELELCIHVDDKAYRFIHQHVENSGDGLWRLKADHASADESIFSEFVFPILNLSKIEMEEQARARGFYDIMLMTWF
jgi:hypothetical protein